MSKINFTTPDAYFEALGTPQPGQSLSLIDDYRFYIVFKHLSSGSVLDVGAYYGDFLKLALKNGRKIVGTEVNQDRVSLSNNILGDDVIVLGFRNGSLSSFEDKSIDNVVCTEVLEHIPDHKFAVSELTRVARKKVIITVPFRETIQNALCIHCCKLTPYSGHLHSYDLHTFDNLVPKNWVVEKQIPIVNKLSIFIARQFKLPRSQAFIPFMQLLDLLLPGTGYWLFVLLRRASNELQNK